jgi:lysophospholipase L1-like esterase
MKAKSLLVLVLAAFLSAPAIGATDAQTSHKITLVGDSTVATYELGDPKRGWGQMLPEYLSSKAEVINLAVPGASAKTFLASEKWPKALASGNGLLLIQFGHNDGKIGKHPGATAADGEFQDLLLRMIREARQSGLTPVLVTPMHRLKFETDGKMSSELLPYAEAIRKVGREQRLNVIDLYAASGRIFEPLGLEGSLDLNPSEKDRVHFSEKGARLLAALVAEDLNKLNPVLVK